MFPRWLSWLIFLVLGYLVFAASQMDTKSVSSESSVVKPITQEHYPALAEATDVERWKRALDPSYAAKMNCTVDKPKAKGLVFKVIETDAGSGDGAQCGDTITIALTVWNANGGAAYEGSFDMALGSREIASGLDAGLVGSKPGSERMVVLAPYAVVRGKESKAPAAAVKALPVGKMAVVTVKRIK